MQDAKDPRQAKGSGDTLYDLVGGEVQVYISKQHTQTWTQPYGRSYLVYRGSSGSTDPNVDFLISKYAGAYGVDPALVRAVMRNESDFNPMAVSPRGPGIDAVDAWHCCPHGRPKPLRPGTEHRRGGELSTRLPEPVRPKRPPGGELFFILKILCLIN